MNCRLTVFLGLSVRTHGVIAMVIRKRAVLLSAEVRLFCQNCLLRYYLTNFRTFYQISEINSLQTKELAK